MELGDAGSFTQFDNNNIALADDDRVEDDDKRFIIPQQRMVIALPDLNNPDATIQREWGKAPDYRTVYPGLNFEGTCENPKCHARNKKVWCKWGFKNQGVFSWIDDNQDIVCPSCHEYVEPENVGYTKCWWKIEGKKRPQKGKKFEDVKGEWKYANFNGVTTYVYSKETLVDWGVLTIKTSSNNANNKPH